MTVIQPEIEMDPGPLLRPLSKELMGVDYRHSFRDKINDSAADCGCRVAKDMQRAKWMESIKSLSNNRDSLLCLPKKQQYRQIYVKTFLMMAFFFFIISICLLHMDIAFMTKLRSTIWSCLVGGTMYSSGSYLPTLGLQTAGE